MLIVVSENIYSSAALMVENDCSCPPPQIKISILYDVGVGCIAYLELIDC